MESTPVHGAMSRSAARPVGQYDRLFYSGMAVAMAMTVVVGFSATYYSKMFGAGAMTTISGRPFTALVHLHGALFTCWVLFFVAQTSLVASRRVAVHRRLGLAGAGLATAMVSVGVAVAVSSAGRGNAPPGMDPLAFLAVPLFDMILFTGFIAAAIVKRRDGEAHKRLMLLAYVSLLAAPIARIPGILPLGPLAYFGLAGAFIVLGALYDLATRGRIHRAYLWGGALFVLSVPVRILISTTAAWRALATALTT